MSNILNAQIDLTDSTLFDNDKVIVQYKINDWFKVASDTLSSGFELIDIDSNSVSQYDTYTYSVDKDSTILLQGVKSNGWAFQQANVSECKVLFMYKDKLAEIKLGNSYNALNTYEYINK
tara:strand:- start:26 stop:385 length:360 start_codon:yes stop_codon:yes gene_type:complete